MGFMEDGLGPMINVGGSLIGAGLQGLVNRRFADKSHKRNMELLKYQLDYNSPANQMARYKEAGLNPHLIYGQGSPGNLDSPPRYPDVKPPDVNQATIGIATQMAQLKLLQAQAGLTNQKTEESGMKQDLIVAQTDLARANPYLQPGYVDKLFMGLKATAEMKKQESDFMLSGQAATGATTQGQAKMMLEINRLAQQLGLGDQDKEIKAKIIQSKEFQNALQAIQVKWMQDKEITPQHIYMGIMLLLQKMF